jgi:hypothetical protein
MKIASFLGFVLLSAVAARADCPPDCVAGGGPPATDCFLAWSASQKATCVDGTECDVDGVADGACTFGLQACVNVSGLPSCTPGTLDGTPIVSPSRDPLAAQLVTAVAALDPAVEGCTSMALRLPLKVSLAGIKPGKSRMTVAASSGGKHDKDKVRLVCQKNLTAPSLANQVQPILTQRCAIPACHMGSSPSGGQNLEAGQSYAQSVNVRSIGSRTLRRVKPFNVKASFMARKILGVGIPPGIGGSIMPQGCPGLPPTGGCLTEEETFTILLWIADGAPNN